MSRMNGFIGRRNFLKVAGLTTLSIGGITACNGMITNREAITIPENNPNPNPVSANEAQRRLVEGNRRFYNQNRQYPNQSKRRLQSVAKTQYPYAAILGCADSRVPPEIVFDQGLGDLFVVRVAGNIASDATIGSLEYAAAALGTQLIVILGHKRCGAVQEAIKNEQFPGRINSVVDSIKPALAQNQPITNDVDSNKDAVINNIKYQTEQLQRNSPVLERLTRDDRLKIVSAFYDIDTGKVQFLNGSLSD
ncbi:carbonic anhydrase [Sphaerospermopsis aphanizomenoides BCCUSP55]|uniref:carbonic anhydrase n=1 Tax=Sphaerospermopsis aphanizomenoides TaxID=459663 RepID=UPI000A7181CC|nr:carbonic anhydrase [Sphaerospermopsis aphanizomenoides]MBK1988181.1 carbonic anhydrase [Sphaerospermopsis aphanizomenoides BCCUSP55]